VKAWLQRLGIIPDDQTMAIAALAVSIEDWKRELKRSQRRQRRDDQDEEEE
jgi:hypothetical protein